MERAYLRLIISIPKIAYHIIQISSAVIIRENIFDRLIDRAQQPEC